jgi:hypothetical protein
VISIRHWQIDISIMPAIQLARLRQSSAQLIQLFEQPKGFVRNLHSLLNDYANRTHRPGQSGEPAPLLESYNVPKPVIRQILTDTRPLAVENSEAALNLCDELWNESYFEFRFLAAAILGQITPDPPEPVLERVIRWSDQISDVQLMEVLFDRGLNRIKLEKPEYLIDQIDRWLDDPNTAVKKIGLQALIPLVRSANFENLPIFFRYITPLVRELPSALRIDMRDVVMELSIRSPVETAYFLRQLISLSSSANAAWLARQNLRHFPPDVQKSLRNLLRAPLPEK